jgi:hypothetical protein
MLKLLLKHIKNCGGGAGASRSPTGAKSAPCHLWWPEEELSRGRNRNVVSIMSEWSGSEFQCVMAAVQKMFELNFCMSATPFVGTTEIY